MAVVVALSLFLGSASGEPATRKVDAALVKTLADSEVAAGRLPLRPGTCLGLEQDRNPPDRLLRALRAIGANFRKASACMRPPNGILFTVGPVTDNGPRQIRVHVEVSDMNIEEGSHFATILSRGIYIMAEDSKTGWVVLDYQSTGVK